MHIDVHWLRCESAQPAWLQQSQSWLSETERSRLSRMAVAHRVREFLLGRWLLRSALATELGAQPCELEIGEGEHGRPRLVGRAAASAVGLDFNTSHGGGVIAVAVARGGQVGVDVEDLHRPLPTRRIERFLAVEECDDLRCADPGDLPVLFWRTWTLKEALLKAVGSGIAGGLQSVAVRLGEPSGVARFDPSPADRLRWELREFRLKENVQLAIAGLADPGDPLTLTLHHPEAC